MNEKTWAAACEAVVSMIDRGMSPDEALDALNTTPELREAARASYPAVILTYASYEFDPILTDPAGLGAKIADGEARELAPHLYPGEEDAARECLLSYENGWLDQYNRLPKTALLLEAFARFRAAYRAKVFEHYPLPAWVRQAVGQA